MQENDDGCTPMIDQTSTNLPAAGTRMTAAEFLELPETTQPIELLNGEILVSPSPVPNHQRTVFNVGKHVETLIPNGEVFLAPIDVYFDDENIVQPDVIWVAENSRCQITERRLEGAPDLIVEVLSPGTERVDRGDKFRLYERLGVREYWLVAPLAQYVEVYRLDGDTFTRLGVFAPGETFESAVLGGKMVAVGEIFKQG